MERFNGESEKNFERVKKLLQGLKELGYVFELEETSDEYLLRTKGKEFHYPKLGRIPVSHDDQKTQENIEKVIAARIIDPEGDLYSVIRSDKFLGLGWIENRK